MPKGMLEFNLPEETEEFKSAQNGGAYSAAAWNFGEWLRRRFKHEDPKSEEVKEFYQEVWQRFKEEFEDLYV